MLAWIKEIWYRNFVCEHVDGYEHMTDCGMGKMHVCRRCHKRTRIA